MKQMGFTELSFLRFEDGGEKNNSKETFEVFRLQHHFLIVLYLGQSEL